MPRLFSCLPAAPRCRGNRLRGWRRPDDTFSVGLVTAIGIGDDTDTVAAIAGAQLGARYGASTVPAEWRRMLHGYPRLTPSGSSSRPVGPPTGAPSPEPSRAVSRSSPGAGRRCLLVGHC
ncbi:MAG: ADP-ribosylglycohydrolase family protein, partial [Nocardioides sp.]|nr:ADP-ribosylglycohydrolase family protein [Nocardioides sp.]